MALSTRTKDISKQAFADITASAEVVAAIDANSAKVATVITAISTADATDLASSIALANANKAKVNAILVALKAAGLMANS